MVVIGQVFVSLRWGEGRNTGDVEPYEAADMSPGGRGSSRERGSERG